MLALREEEIEILTSSVNDPKQLPRPVHAGQNAGRWQAAGRAIQRLPR